MVVLNKPERIANHSHALNKGWLAINELNNI